MRSIETEGVRRGPRSGRMGPVDPCEQRTPKHKRGPGAANHTHSVILGLDPRILLSINHLDCHEEERSSGQARG